jgi:putative tryptophan/tyrosine transport system substrate-binding protein
MRRREFIAALGAAAWPLVARGQQAALPVIGVLNLARPDPVRSHLIASFQQGLKESGFVEGENVETLYRYAENQPDRLPALAEDLVNRKVAVIVCTGGTVTAIAVKTATAEIPIVFQLGGDPVANGLVTSLNRPGGNLTGATFLTQELFPKRLELLRDMLPAATTIGFLLNPSGISTKIIPEFEAAARALGIHHLLIVNARSAADIEHAFKTLIARRIDALFIDSDSLFFVQQRQIVDLANQYAIPASYQYRETVEAGGLMSYGGRQAEPYRIAGNYAGRILKGEKPADLPVQQVVHIEMAINLKTAKALGLTIPPNLLALADEVIE